MDAVLNEYILNEHTNQIRDNTIKLHELKKAYEKEQQILDQAMDKVEINIALITTKLEENIKRLDRLEMESIKKSTLKELIKYIPIAVIMLAIIDYGKLIQVMPNLVTFIKSMVQL